MAQGLCLFLFAAERRKERGEAWEFAGGGEGGFKGRDECLGRIHSGPKCMVVVVILIGL